MTLTDIRPAEFPWFRYDGYTFSLGLTDGTSAWLSGHSASEYDPQERRIVVRGAMTEQAGTAYAKIATILRAAGLDWGDVTRVVENVTVAGIEQYAHAANVRAATLGAHRPAVVTVVVDRLLRPAALIEIEVSATRGGGRGSRGRGDEGTAPATGDGALPAGVGAGRDGLLYLPTVLPVDAHGNLVAPGDPVAQYAFCLDRIEALLGGLGLPIERVAKLVETASAGAIDPSDEVPALRRARVGAVATGRITVGRLLVPGALVALDAIASRQEPVELARGRAPGDDAAAVRAGKTVFLAQASAAPAGRGSPPGDVITQARDAYRWILDVLSEVGGEVQDEAQGEAQLVKTIEYVVPAALADYRGVAEVRQDLLRAPWPASTGAVCTAVGSVGGSAGGSTGGSAGGSVALIGVDATAVIG